MAAELSIQRQRNHAPGATPIVLSIALGTLFTWCLFAGMAYVGRLNPDDPPARFEDLRAVSLPFEPPPPPPRSDTVADDPAPVGGTVTGLDEEPSDSPVRIAISPPDLDALSATVQVAPPALIQIGRAAAEFKPRTEIGDDVQHIYQRSEVDLRPRVLFRKVPLIPPWVRGNAESLRVNLLLVIDAAGSVGRIRVATSSGNPQFDAIIADTIKEWGFSPAVRRGRNVKCFVEQSIRVDWTGGSHFEAN
jgi:TonB family protein